MPFAGGNGSQIKRKEEQQYEGGEEEVRQSFLETGGGNGQAFFLGANGDAF